VSMVTDPGEDPADEQDEGLLLQRIALERDRDAFAALFKIYAPRLKAFLIRRGHAPAVAEDLVQDVMLTLWHKAHTYQEERGAVSTWLFRIAKNRGVDQLRKQHAAVVDPKDPCLVWPERQAHGDELLERSERSHSLHHELACLPDEQQTVLAAAYLEHKTMAQIASDHRVPMGTIKSRIRRALERLRSQMLDGSSP